MSRAKTGTRAADEYVNTTVDMLRQSEEYRRRAAALERKVSERVKGMSAIELAEYVRLTSV